jgi:hypothetical protein
LILYVNGDSHSAGAEAVNGYCFANDDPLYWGLARRPHPDNERASYGCHIANLLGARLHCEAESASSNTRIIRTTHEYLTINKPDLIIIGWSTWEREEWWDESTKTHWQINAGGAGDDWPLSVKQRYTNWILNKNYSASAEHAHQEIFALHNELLHQNIPHLFFNTFLPCTSCTQVNWQGCYLEPYSPDFTYYNWCQNRGFATVRPDSYHFGADAHQAWAEFLYSNMVLKLLTAK